MSCKTGRKLKCPCGTEAGTMVMNWDFNVSITTYLILEPPSFHCNSIIELSCVGLITLYNLTMLETESKLWCNTVCLQQQMRISRLDEQRQPWMNLKGLLTELTFIPLDMWKQIHNVPRYYSRTICNILIQSHSLNDHQSVEMGSNSSNLLVFVRDALKCGWLQFSVLGC